MLPVENKNLEDAVDAIVSDSTRLEFMRINNGEWLGIVRDICWFEISMTGVSFYDVVMKLLPRVKEAQERKRKCQS